MVAVVGAVLSYLVFFVLSLVIASNDFGGLTLISFTIGYASAPLLVAALFMLSKKFRSVTAAATIILIVSVLASCGEIGRLPEALEAAEAKKEQAFLTSCQASFERHGGGMPEQHARICECVLTTATQRTGTKAGGLRWLADPENRAELAPIAQACAGQTP